MLGCSFDPAAPLIRTPDRVATVSPSQAPERSADGFANILADPVTVAGLPRHEREIAAEQSQLEADARRAERATAGIATTSSVAALQARGRDHVAEARAAIEASGREQAQGAGPASAAVLPGSAAALTPAAAQSTASTAAVDPGKPLDPAAPQPRTVGGPSFTGSAVAPPR